MQHRICLSLAAALVSVTASAALPQSDQGADDGTLCIFDCDTAAEAPDTPDVGTSSVFDETAETMGDAAFLGDLTPEVAVPDAPDFGRRDTEAAPPQ